MNVAKVITNNFGFMLFSVKHYKNEEKCYFMNVVRKLAPRYRLRPTLPYYCYA